MTDRPPYAARSDVGRVRTGNEDRFLAEPPLFAVADGMGGHQAGEVAAALVIGTLASTAATPGGTESDAVVDAIVRSNSLIRTKARTRDDLLGMGTTCTVAVVVPGEVRIAHVGDSRAYRLRNGRLEQLTEDHSLVATMVREGALAPDQARTDARRNVITRALGAEDGVQVDVVTSDIQSGDRLLLCSDGLTGLVSDATIQEVLAGEPDAAMAVDRLVDLANAAGGDDNVTVIVVEAEQAAAVAPGGADAAAPAPTAVADGVDGPARRRHLVRRVVVVVIVAVIAAIGLGLALAPSLGTGPTFSPSPSLVASPSSVASPSPSVVISPSASVAPSSSAAPSTSPAPSTP